ncbi:hypothetical protein VSU19_19165 [Verrucomicrobiales bacterium BCK34]|nr:hypothetical protein [Verrucomicrobiales bacterium BCK34]
MSATIADPLLTADSELIIEDGIQNDEALMTGMLADIAGMSQEVKSTILSAMLRMHRYLEEECGDLDVSLHSEHEILENTSPQYVILDESSNEERRAVRYHYRCNWETWHGVEVIVINGTDVLFVGNCGDSSSIENEMTRQNNSNFMAVS